MPQLGIGYGVIAMLFPELVFAAVLNVVYVKGIIDITLGRSAKWKHVTHTLPSETASEVAR